MKPSSISLLAKALLVGWSVAYLPYALLIVWVGTGPDALAGPSTTTDNIIAGAWLVLSFLQIFIATSLYKRYRPWLFWVALVLATLSFGSVIMGPILALMGAG